MTEKMFVFPAKNSKEIMGYLIENIGIGDKLGGGEAGEGYYSFEGEKSNAGVSWGENDIKVNITAPQKMINELNELERRLK